MAENGTLVTYMPALVVSVFSRVKFIFSEVRLAAAEAWHG